MYISFISILLYDMSFRREVTAIDKESDGGFTVTVRHWEPKEYVDSLNTPANDKAHKKDNINVKNAMISTMIKSTCVGLALAMLTGKIILPVLKAQGHHALAENESIISVIIVIFMNILGIVLTNNKVNELKKASAKSSSSGSTVTAYDKPPVGENGKKVSVEDMKVGGSGSCNIMNGVTVGVEKFRTRYVVNAAGSYSDKIAEMVGDKSFYMKPRLGDYLLLNRNQVLSH
jgi:hypothetical protein